MILPTKNLSEDRALLRVGADILGLLSEPKTVSRLWEEVKRKRHNPARLLAYDWFVLALDLLYMLNAIELDHGRIRRIER